MCIKPERKGGVPNAGGARCPPRGRSRAGCAGAAPEAGVFVLEKNGAVIGALTLRAGEIFGCAVAPEWRGRGYGTFLLRRALRAAGPGPVCTQTPPGNAAMEALLRRCGFRPQEQALPAAGEEPARAREAGAAAGPLSLPQKWVRGAPDGDGENALAVAHAFLRTHGAARRFRAGRDGGQRP